MRLIGWIALGSGSSDIRLIDRTRDLLYDAHDGFIIKKQKLKIHFVAGSWLMQENLQYNT